MQPAIAVNIEVTDAPLAAADDSDLSRVMTFTGPASFSTAVATEVLTQRGLGADVPARRGLRAGVKGVSSQ